MGSNRENPQRSDIRRNILWQTRKEIILSGDFNAKLKVERNNTIVQQESENGEFLQQLIDDNNLVPINLKDKY